MPHQKPRDPDPAGVPAQIERRPASTQNTTFTASCTCRGSPTPVWGRRNVPFQPVFERNRCGCVSRPSNPRRSGLNRPRFSLIPPVASNSISAPRNHQRPSIVAISGLLNRGSDTMPLNLSSRSNSSGTTGRGTSASCATWSNGWRFSRTETGFLWPIPLEIRLPHSSSRASGLHDVRESAGARPHRSGTRPDQLEHVGCCPSAPFARRLPLLVVPSHGKCGCTRRCVFSLFSVLSI